MPHITRVRLAIQCHWTLDQQALALRCGIDGGRLSRYVRGEALLTHPHRAILAHVLRVEPDELEGWVSGPELWQKLAS